MTGDHAPLGDLNALPEALRPRRVPRQERSRRRVDAILSAARELLVEVGLESFTCEQVAARAEVPVGSLYQFFGNKYALVCELDRVDTEDVQRELEGFAAEIPSLEWARLLERHVDHLAGLWRDDPSRRAVWLAMQLGPSTRVAAALHERQLAAQVTRLLAPLTPGSPVAARQEIAEVVVAVTYSALNFSVRDGQSHPRAVAQLKAMLTSYLRGAEAEALARRAASSPTGAVSTATARATSPS